MSEEEKIADSFARKKELEELRQKYEDAHEFIIHLATRNWWCGYSYTNKILDWIKRNPF